MKHVEAYDGALWVGAWMQPPQPPYYLPPLPQTPHRAHIASRTQGSANVYQPHHNYRRPDLSAPN